MKIWGRNNSINVRKVLWCAEELGVAYERVEAGGAFGVVDTPAYRALNPNGRVPTLQDGELVLWESNAIVRYLARRYGAGRFAADDPAAFASADKWMDWASTSFGGPYRDVFWNMVRMTPETRDAAAVERGLAECGRLLEIPEAQLSRTPYLSGEDLGIGDIPLGCAAYGWFEMPIERPDFPNLAAWYERLKQRPAYRAGVMTPLT
ncbi:glutathione S-transferase family protein [Jiella sonneratiae]|uniref:Glutathione S-transferase n=1 Tax=Jiella sonneratiae TaxID=2816856 RepID=A0ABS3J5T6_9HYPH|nr:glutathione S-transferase [Jiella sonneratiae]MBO0905034.1 glutathione S-transferase [Jiella sonneratiae]